MTICNRLKTFLDSHGVRYVTVTHSPAYTAQEIAARAHIRGRNLVKCVMVSGDGQHSLVALTANQRLNLDKLRQALGAKKIRLEKEDEFAPLFADCEPGAMPPFGNLYNLPVVVDEALYEDEEIAFNAGNHTSVVKMAFADFERLVKPQKAAVADRS